MIFSLIFSAKTIKNVVCVNEELTAEEWKRRYEKEKEKVGRFKGKCEKLELELSRWRSGETVTADEQVNLTEPLDATTPVSGTGPLEVPIKEIGPVPATPSAGLLMTGSLSNDERQKLEAEREGLYQQLDEKDEEINQHSQYVEKLKEQMLEQEEVLPCIILYLCHTEIFQLLILQLLIWPLRLRSKFESLLNLN